MRPWKKLAPGMPASSPKEANAQPAAPAPAAIASTDAPVHFGGTQLVGFPFPGFSDAPGCFGAEFVMVRLGVADLPANRLKRREALAQLWTDISRTKALCLQILAAS
ncbi:hypothetical protein IMZ48_28985 [Candidatus Bathyarchaeota archaeon]|nr:hypothetical protein [Candidatus Bathyarchaeota archaeon]